MEIRENIPSYINFGSYKHQLMVEYAGQPKTCRLCESPYHIYSECPKLTRNTVAQKQVESHVAGPRSYSSVAAPSYRPSTSGWQTRSGGKNVPTEVAKIVKMVAILEEALSSDGESNGSKLVQTEAVNDAPANAHLASTKKRNKPKKGIELERAQRPGKAVEKDSKSWSRSVQ